MNRTLQHILYGGASLRRMSIAELSHDVPVLLVFLNETNGVDDLLGDIEWLETAVGHCAGTRLVVVHHTTDVHAARVLAAHGLGRALTIPDPDGRIQKLFRENAAGASSPVDGPYLIVKGKVVTNLDRVMTAA